MQEYTYKFRIYPSIEQEIQLSKTFGCTRFIYNYYLSLSKDNNYKGKYNNNNDCNRVLKLEYPWLKEVDKFSLSNSIFNLDKAFQRFFKEKTGYPKFKSRRSMQSYQTNYTNNNIEVLDNYIKLPKLGLVKAKVHRNVEGTIINSTVKKYQNGNYYVCILVRREIEEKDIAMSVVGLDMGVKDFIVDSKGNKYEAPKPLRALETKLTKHQQKLSTKIPNSNNYHKQKIKVARIHEKIENIRNDYLHKLSTKIINENQVIIVEDLDVVSMLQNKIISKSLSDVSISKFINMLEYKSKMYRKAFYKVNRYYASTQICHICGKKNQEVKDLSIRSWECPSCSTYHDRDKNAAINILNYGLDKIFAY